MGIHGGVIGQTQGAEVCVVALHSCSCCHSCCISEVKGQQNTRRCSSNTALACIASPKEITVLARCSWSAACAAIPYLGA